MARLVYGIQPVREAIRVHAQRVTSLLIQADGGPRLDALARLASRAGLVAQSVSSAQLDRQSRGGHHQGVIALVPDIELVTPEQVSIQADTVILLLDGVMDPQNFGAVIRSAVALGAPTIVWPEHCSAPLTPTTFRAAAGAIEHATLCRVPSLSHAISSFSQRGAATVALDAQAKEPLGNLSLVGPVALVVGSEDKGIRKGILRGCDHLASLPMKGPVASLNVSVAAALALYEVLSQRRRLHASE